MFGKLLKNDLKAQWHSMSTIFLCIALVAVGAEIFTLTTKQQAMKVLGGMLVFIALGFACIVVLIAVALMFSKTMFGRAGYLTLSIPVKTSSLLISKTVSGLIWIFSVYALFIGSLFLWVYQVKQTLGDQILDSVESILTIFGVPSFLTIFIGILFFLISLAVLTLVMVQALQLSITLSNISPISKFGNLGIIVMFFVIFLVVQSVTTELSDLLPIGFVVDADTVKFTNNIVRTKAAMGGNGLSIGICGSIFRLLSAIGLHYPTVYLIQHKINIK